MTKRIARTGLLLWLLAQVVSPEAYADSVTATFLSEASQTGGTALSIRGVLSRPKGEGPFPAIVLLANCGGPATYEFAKFWPRYLNQLGYVTLNVDSFTPRRVKNCSKSYIPDLGDIERDAYGALKHLAGLSYVDGEKISVFGSSLGAHAINVLVGSGRATSQGLKFQAAISLYPVHCKGLTAKAEMIPTLIVQGDKERGVRTCKRHAGHRFVTVAILTDTYHGFDQPSATRRKNGSLRTDVKGNKRLFSQSATLKAQALVKEFLTARLSSPAIAPETQPANALQLGKVNNKDPYKAVSKRDNDGDGRVSLSEWEKSSVIFAKIDSDRDGFLTPKEFFEHWQRQLQ